MNIWVKILAVHGLGLVFHHLSAAKNIFKELL